MARLNIQHITKKVIPYYFTLQQAQTEKDQSEARGDLYKGLQTIADRVEGPYFFGEKWSVVDMSLAPFVRRFYNLEEYRGMKQGDIGEKWVKYHDALLGLSFLLLTLTLESDVKRGKA